MPCTPRPPTPSEQHTSGSHYPSGSAPLGRKLTYPQSHPQTPAENRSVTLGKRLGKRAGDVAKQGRATPDRDPQKEAAQLHPANHGHEPDPARTSHRQVADKHVARSYQPQERPGRTRMPPPREPYTCQFQATPPTQPRWKGYSLHACQHKLGRTPANASRAGGNPNSPTGGSPLPSKQQPNPRAWANAPSTPTTAAPRAEPEFAGSLPH